MTPPPAVAGAMVPVTCPRCGNADLHVETCTDCEAPLVGCLPCDQAFHVQLTPGCTSPTPARGAWL